MKANNKLIIYSTANFNHIYVQLAAAANDRLAYAKSSLAQHSTAQLSPSLFSSDQNMVMFSLLTSSHHALVAAGEETPP